MHGCAFVIFSASHPQVLIVKLAVFCSGRVLLFIKVSEVAELGEGDGSRSFVAVAMLLHTMSSRLGAMP